MSINISNDDQELLSFVSEVSARLYSQAETQALAIQALNPIQAAANQEGLTRDNLRGLVLPIRSQLEELLSNSKNEEEIEQQLERSSDEEYETASSASPTSTPSLSPEPTPSSSSSSLSPRHESVALISRQEEIERTPDPTPMQYENYTERMKNLIVEGDRYLSNGQFALALNSYGAAASVNSDSPRPWIKIGELYMKAGHFAEAVRAFHKSIEMDSGFIAPYLSLAEIYTHANDLASAIRCYSKVLQLEPFHETALEKRAELIGKLVNVD